NYLLLLRNFLKGFCIPIYWFWCMPISGPFHTITDDSLNLFIMICWIGFVTWPEIKYLSPATVECRSTSKHFSTFKPTDKYKLIWCWYIKMFSIHFFFFQFDILTDSLRDRMRWIDHP